MIRVLIADEHVILRRGLKEILVRELKGAVYGEAKDAAEILARIREGAWDLVILGITMAGLSGLDVLLDLKAGWPNLPVLVISMHPEDQYAKRTLKAGASGYVDMNKESAPEELIKAARKVLAGGLYVSGTLAEKLAADLSENAGRPPHEGLSDRELEVLRRVGEGKTVSEIAGELHLGVTTVYTYRARILKKMNVTTTAELIHYALHIGLID